MFYYGNIDGLTRPPNNSFWRTQMKIAAFSSKGSSFHVQQLRVLKGLPRIVLQYENKSSEETIGLTIHELAHAAHWRVDKSAYNDLVHDAYIGPLTTPGNEIGPTERNNRMLLESWATGVEIYLTRKYYRTHGNPTYEYKRTSSSTGARGNLQNTQITDPKGQYYTSIIWDLIDTFNQRTDFGSTYITFPNDRVSGFSMPQLEKALKSSRYWDQYRNNLKSQNPTNATIGSVSELFANWN